LCGGDWEEEKKKSDADTQCRRYMLLCTCYMWRPMMTLNEQGAGLSIPELLGN
jgi:hypothetical protein